MRAVLKILKFTLAKNSFLIMWITPYFDYREIIGYNTNIPNLKTLSNPHAHFNQKTKRDIGLY